MLLIVRSFLESGPIQGFFFNYQQNKKFWLKYCPLMDVNKPRKKKNQSWICGYMSSVCVHPHAPEISVKLIKVKLTPLKFFFKVTKSMYEAWRRNCPKLSLSHFLSSFTDSTQERPRNQNTTLNWTFQIKNYYLAQQTSRHLSNVMTH